MKVCYSLPGNKKCTFAQKLQVSLSFLQVFWYLRNYTCKLSYKEEIRNLKLSCQNNISNRKSKGIKNTGRLKL